jgi:hypothetical protein
VKPAGIPRCCPSSPPSQAKQCIKKRHPLVVQGSSYGPHPSGICPPRRRLVRNRDVTKEHALEVGLAAAGPDQDADQTLTPLPLPSLTGEEQDKGRAHGRAKEVQWNADQIATASVYLHQPPMRRGHAPRSSPTELRACHTGQCARNHSLSGGAAGWQPPDSPIPRPQVKDEIDEALWMSDGPYPITTSRLPFV